MYRHAQTNNLFGFKDNSNYTTTMQPNLSKLRLTTNTKKDQGSVVYCSGPCPNLPGTAQDWPGTRLGIRRQVFWCAAKPEQFNIQDNTQEKQGSAIYYSSACSSCKTSQAQLRIRQEIRPQVFLRFRPLRTAGTHHTPYSHHQRTNTSTQLHERNINVDK